jgi:hypothetical protein
MASTSADVAAIPATFSSTTRPLRFRCIVRVFKPRQGARRVWSDNHGGL